MNCRNLFSLAVVIVGLVIECQTSQAEDKPGYFTDPATGIVYQKIVRPVEQPVVETKMVKKETTVFRPETVTESVPVKSSVFVPETRYVWQPVLHGRWNPFRQPTITYHHVPQSQWKQQVSSETRTQTVTKYIPEKRMVDVPERIVRMERKEQIDFVPVGRVAPQPAAPPRSVPDAIAARMRPLPANTPIQTVGRDPRPYNRGLMPSTAPSTSVARGWTPRGSVSTRIASNPSGRTQYGYGTSFGSRPFGATSSPNASTRIAATTMGQLKSDPPRRSPSQGGMKPTDLYPNQSTGYGQALPPASSGTGIANLPGWSLWR